MANPDEIYLIKKLELHPMEKWSTRSYSFPGFFYKEESAKNFCEKGRKFTQEDCWDIGKDEILDEYSYIPIKMLDNI